ncbi:competence protein CoiA [Oenococcus sp.]|uniref:competence protein CoiA n=1 Tax=Oenococcus sp. TaxID=1979414 RepID=UPI0039E81A9E
MLIAKNRFGELIEADQAIAGQLFSCPGCQRPLCLKKGQIKMPHFAHRPGMVCDYFSENESQLHLVAKKCLNRILTQVGYQTQLEKVFPEIKQRADLWIQDADGRQLAIEFQQSPISVDKLRQRTAGYHRIGLQVIWILGPNYFRQHLQERTIFKFADANDMIFTWAPSSNQLTVCSCFQKNDLSVLKMQQHQYSPESFFDIFLRGSHHSSQQVQAIRSKSYLRRDLKHMQQQLTLKRFSPDLVRLVYEQKHTSPINAPWLVHGGNQAGLKVSNQHWRLAMLLALEAGSETGRLSRNAFIKEFSSESYFYERSWENHLSQQAVVNFLRELSLVDYIYLKSAYILVRSLPPWPDNYQQKLALLR